MCTHTIEPHVAHHVLGSLKETRWVESGDLDTLGYDITALLSLNYDVPVFLRS